MSGLELRLLSQSEWDSMYGQPKIAPSLLLHGLIARDAPEPVTLQKIQEMKQFLDVADSDHDGLTPLIIATMKGKVTIFRALLSCCANNQEKKRVMNRQDAHSWSAFQHAFLSSKSIFELLRAEKASREVAIPFKEIDLLRTYQVASHTLSHVFVQEDDSSPLVPLLDFGIQKFAIACFRDIPYYPDQTLKLLWRRTTQDDQNFVSAAFRRWLEHPHKLVIGKCKELAHIAHPFELRAGEFIPAGTCLGVYTGTATDSFVELPPSTIRGFKMRLEKETYLFDHLDAKSVGGALRMANWGWPNAVMEYVTHEGQTDPVLITITDIAPGNPILYNYALMEGLSYYAASPILGADSMRSFYREHDFDELVLQCQDLKEFYGKNGKEVVSPAEYKKSHLLPEALVFPLCFPAAILDLHYRNIVHVEKWAKLLDSDAMERNIFLKAWALKTKYSVLVLRALCLHVSNLDQHIQYEPLKEKVATWITERIGKYSVLQLAKAISIIDSKLEMIGADISCWDQVALDIETFLADYDPVEDEDCPLGPNTIWTLKLAIMERKPGTPTEKRTQIVETIASARQMGLTGEHDEVKEAKLLFRHYTKILLREAM